jgi:hypothetical protein
MQRDRLPYLLIPLAAFLAIIPLLVNGCSCGHDFDFHVLSWIEAAHQFTHGNLHPHWAFTPAWNAGEPRFVFYPPLSWIIGAVLGLIFPWTWTPILYTWLALTASGLALHRLARDFTTPAAATLAAILYTVNPYMLFTAYERTAYAELLAAAFIPLLLQAILRKQVTVPRIAVPIALLWLTNAPAAVMSCYALALLATIRLATNPGAPSSARSLGLRWASRESATAPAHTNVATTPSQTPLQLTLNTITGTALGLGLAAFYILPAAYERHYVQINMAIIPYLRIQDNFLFHHTADVPHDQVLHTASLIAVILLITTVIALAITLVRNSKRFGPATPERLSKDASSRPERSEVERPPYFVNGSSTTSDIACLLTSITTLTLAITVLLTPFTAFIWNHAPELLFLQFPWRLLAILAAVLALAIALALTPLNLKPTYIAAITLAMAAALTYPAYTLFHQPCDQEDTVQARLALFHSNQGTGPIDEYTPITADNDSIAPTNPAYWLSQDPNAKAPTTTQPGPTPTHLTLNSPTPEDIILNLRDYPAWNIRLNGTPITTREHRDDGLIVLPIPAGPSTIDITYTQTRDQTLGDIISAISLTLLLLTLRRTSRLPSVVKNH